MLITRLALMRLRAQTLFLVREGEVELYSEPDPAAQRVVCPGAPDDPQADRQGSVVADPVLTDDNCRGSFSLIKQTPAKLITLHR